MPRFNVAGLPGGPIELPVPLVIDLLPFSDMHRPGTPRQGPGVWVQHETDNTNPGAGALMHRNFLFAGAPTDQGVEQQLSFHFAVDDGVIYQMVPVNEQAFHAADGGGPGNVQGIACELCVNVDGNKNVARRNAEALAGQICKRLGFGANQVKRHWDFNWMQADPACPAFCETPGVNRHHCPDQMMNDGYWPTFVQHVAAIINGPGTNGNGANGNGFTLHQFSNVRVFHVIANGRATGRQEPTRESAIVMEFDPGTAVSCDGYWDGEEVQGEKRWLRTSGQRHLAIHKSGFSEPI